MFAKWKLQILMVIGFWLKKDLEKGLWSKFIDGDEDDDGGFSNSLNNCYALNSVQTTMREFISPL